MAGGDPVQIALEDDPTPLVRILGATLRRSARNPALESKLRGMHGVVALKSSVDPQAVTIRFDKGRVSLEHGVAADSGVVIEADLTKMNEPDAPKPKVKGAAKHLKLALAAGKVLDPPAGPWQDEARMFWGFAHNHPRMPATLLVVCTDDGARLVLGDGEPEYELHGSARAQLRLHRRLRARRRPAEREALRGRVAPAPRRAHRTVDRVDVRRMSVHAAPTDSASLGAWLDTNAVRTVRTEGVSLDGLPIGKHLHRSKFEHSLPLGPALTELAFGYDVGGTPSSRGGTSGDATRWATSTSVPISRRSSPRPIDPAPPT